MPREPVAGAAEARPQLEVELEALARAEHGEAFRLLGPHMVEREGGRRILVRTIQPYATAVSVVLSGGETIPAKRLELGDGAQGIFEALMPPACQDLEARDYRLRIQWDNGSVSEVPDAYAFPPVLTDFDLHLLGEGSHWQSYEKLGAHVREIAGVQGVQFAVWAPNALRVSVVGDFNRWDGRVHAMRSRGNSGVWEIFVPGVGRWSDLQIRDSLAPGGASVFEGRSLRFRGGVAAEVGVRGGHARRIWMERQRLDARAGEAGVAGRTDFDLRSASGFVAARSGREQPLAHVPRDSPTN